jgi:hypothetical protein
MIAQWIYQDERALKIINQVFIRQLRQFPQQNFVKAIRVIGVTAGMQQDERLPDFHVFGFFALELPNHHDAAENQQNQKKQHEPVLPEKVHLNGLEQTALPCNRELP